jgi:plastocyanin
MDVTKLPVGGMVMGFLVLALAVTFVLAFNATDEGGEEAPANGGQATPADGGGDGGGGDGGGGNQIVMGDNFFDPEEVTVQAGATVTFQLVNEGRAPHNMHIAGPNGEFAETTCDGSGEPCSDPSVIPGGGQGTLTWTAPAVPGEVPFRCDFHVQQMQGTIKVE